MMDTGMLFPDSAARQALDNLPMAVSVLDNEGVLLYYNRRAEEILDRKPSYLGQRVHGLHKKPASAAKIDSMLASFAQGRIEPFVYQASPYGEPITVTVTPLFNKGRFIGCVQSIYDPKSPE